MTNASEGESTWARLRRRKVVQWGIAYAAGAWGLLQGLAYVTTTFHWPEYIQQGVTLALLIGLPIMLVLAWYHGDRGEQRLSAAELTILTLLFLVGGGIFWLYQRGGDAPAASTHEPAAPASPANTADGGPSIAVLPFENRSDEHKDAFFVEGIHDDILTQLSKISALKVISRTSVERFRKTELPLKAIAAQLGVKSILEGGVQRAGDRVRINVQLIDAGTDAHLWAETYDRELTAENIFAIQTELAAAIAGALKAALTPAEKARANAVPTRNLEAWEAYQLGRQRMSTQASMNLSDAVKYFQKAINLDPEFALPYSGLADALISQIGWGGVPESTNLPRAEQLARKALQLGPNLAESWTTSALVAVKKGQNDRAEAEYRKAIALNPNYATAYMRLAGLLQSTGRSEEALAYSKKGLDLDPLSSASNFMNARNLATAGRFDEAEAGYRKVITLDPLRPNTYRDLAMLHAYARNGFVDAISFAEKLVELDPDAPYARCNLSQLYFELGDLTQAARVIDLARKRMPSSADLLLCSGYFRLVENDDIGAERIARQALAIDLTSGAGILLGALDLKRGDYASARSWYAQEYPKMLEADSPEVTTWELSDALDLVAILRMTGETDRATRLLDRSREVITTMPRLGEAGYGIADVRIHALRGDKAGALAALREAERAGWRGPWWRAYRDFDPALASIRNEPEFKAVFADIERDMARQRAEIAKRPKAAPLDLAAVH